MQLVFRFILKNIENELRRIDLTQFFVVVVVVIIQILKRKRVGEKKNTKIKIIVKTSIIFVSQILIYFKKEYRLKLKELMLLSKVKITFYHKNCDGNG